MDRSLTNFSQNHADLHYGLKLVEGTIILFTQERSAWKFILRGITRSIL